MRSFQLNLLTSLRRFILPAKYGKTTKVIIVSTPNGMNHFYRMWNDAEKARTAITVSAHWSEVPGRDEKWKEETIANTGATVPTGI